MNGAGNTTAPDDQFDRLKQPFMTTFISTGVGRKLRVRLNGTDVATQQAGGVGVDTGTAGFTIGSREDIPPGQQIWNGDLSEVLVYNRALDDAAITAVGSYLTTKYDLRETTFAPASTAGSSKIAAISDVEVITDLYFAAFSRPPSDAETAVAQRYIATSQDHRQALEDIAWALLNSQEFLFQH